MVYGTSHGPQDDIGNYLGPCSRFQMYRIQGVVAFGLQGSAFRVQACPRDVEERDLSGSIGLAGG